jgi:hypothetical protein
MELWLMAALVAFVPRDSSEVLVVLPYLFTFFAMKR